jgi:hypothetical protein
MQTTLILGLLLALSVGGNLLQWRNRAVAEATAAGATRTATAKQEGTLDRAGDANAAATTAIAALQQRLNECSAQIAVGETVAKAALAGVTLDRDRISRELAAARKRLADATATGECRDWAAQPSCAVSP